MRIVQATELKRGDVLALPFEKTATIKDDPIVGRKFVQVVTEHGPTRFAKGDEVILEGTP